MKTIVLALATLSLGAPALAQDPATAAAQSAPPAAPADPAAPAAPAMPAAPDAAPSMPAPPAAASAPAPTADTSSYPVCSKTVTDKCVNRSAAPHKTAHKR